MYLAREPVAFFGSGQLFDLRRLVAQLLVCFCKFGASFVLTRRHARENDHENYASAINQSDRNRIDPLTAQ